MKVKEYLELIEAIREVLKDEDPESELMFADDLDELDAGVEVNKATMN